MELFFIVLLAVVVVWWLGLFDAVEGFGRMAAREQGAWESEHTAHVIKRVNNLKEVEDKDVEKAAATIAKLKLIKF